jgi:hypothetical protein
MASTEYLGIHGALHVTKICQVVEEVKKQLRGAVKARAI